MQQPTERGHGHAARKAIARSEAAAPSPASGTAASVTERSQGSLEPTPGATSPAASTAASLEIELKLAASPENLERLLRSPVIRHAARGRAHTRSLTSVYYDTPDFALLHEGVALRLRRDGRRWAQTIKAAGKVQGGLHLRDELETPVPAQILNFHALAASGMSRVFEDQALRAELRPLFATEFRRTLRDLEPQAGLRIELAVDVGHIRAGPAGAAISEAELELKEGAPEVLLDFALTLLEQVPLRLEPASKAQRGYALVAGKPLPPTKAECPALERTMSVSDAFRAVAFGCLAHLQANEPGLLASVDPEYLHQARVALRRLRSALSVFSGAFPRVSLEPLVAQLRWLGGLLGPARDWDVLATQTLPPLAETFPGDPALHALIEHVAELRGGADAVAREAVASPRYTTMLLDLIATFYRCPWDTLADEAAAVERDRPLEEFCASVLAHRHRRVIRRGRHLAQLDGAGLHTLRIRIKKLRYAAEFFSSLYATHGVHDYTAALAHLQSLLGGINDAATVERLCERLREREDYSAPALTEAIGVLRGWAGAAASTHRSGLDAAWQAFRDVQKFW